MNGTELKQGMRIQFNHDGPDPIDGIVNGEPWVWWNGIDAEARIPVHVYQLNANIDVAGHNVFKVASEPRLREATEPITTRIEAYSSRA